MNPSFVSALTRALPSIGRPLQLRVSPFSSIRSFSSSPATPANDTGATRELEKHILGVPSAADEDSPKSALDQFFETRKSGQKTSSVYRQMAESLEAEILKQPYADRAPPHYLHIYAHRRNTILTLTKPNGNVMLSLSCGHLGFRKSGRSGYDPAFQLTSHFFAQMHERAYMLEIKRLELVFRDFGQGREAFTKVLMGNEGKNVRNAVVSVTDSTRLKFGGTKSRHVRRLG